MGEDTLVTITKEILEQGRSVRNGWSHRQLHLLGVETPLKNGWQHTLIGRQVPMSNVNEFLSLKDQHLVRKQRYKNLFETKSPPLPFGDGI